MLIEVINQSKCDPQFYRNIKIPSAKVPVSGACVLSNVFSLILSSLRMSKILKSVRLSNIEKGVRGIGDGGGWRVSREE